MNVVAKLVKENLTNREKTNQWKVREPGWNRCKYLVDIKLDESRLAFPLLVIAGLDFPCGVFASTA
jgi:hypothetical protein